MAYGRGMEDGLGEGHLATCHLGKDQDGYTEEEHVGGF